MKLNDVNSTDISSSIRLGCNAMQNIFDADTNEAPFFGAVARPNARLSFNAEASEAHVPGRHLNALLNAQDTLGINIDEEAINKHSRTAFRSYSGSIALPINRADKKSAPVNFDPHNIREGLHALYSLVKYRHSDRAQFIAEACIDAIFKHWGTDGKWNFNRLERDHGLKCTEYDFQGFISGIARAIGPLVKYYETTGYTPAIKLANVLKERSVEEFFKTDGLYDGEKFGHHTHSTTCVMSSLAQLANVTSDSTLMDRVKSFYDNGLWDIRDFLGWVIESSRNNADPDRGEINNSGDILETCLILGNAGYTECFDDAERILRGHILPSQLRDISFIKQPSNPHGEDGLRDVANRLRGSFGFPAPYGHESLDTSAIKFNLDVVGGAVGSLCEAIRNITTKDEIGHHVNLLFDHNTPEIMVESPYTHSDLRVMIRQPAPLYIRIPKWVNRDKLTIDGISSNICYSNGYVFINNPPVNQWIRLSFPMTESESILYHRTREIRVRLRGDEVIAMDNFGTDLTFFEPF